MIIKKIHHNLYNGKGKTIKDKDRNIEMPLFEGKNDEAKDYVANDRLRDAVNVAISMGMPLLLTGEPGTGKTQLADSIAYELCLPGPFIFHTKTTSNATDLFYRYDAMRHFQDIQLNQKNSKYKYISYEALGKAIILGANPEKIKIELDSELINYERPTRSVILIDEIDKAPRDLPNDILNEIENMKFKILETDDSFEAESFYRPIVILTSNSEKNLPDAFLRRCVFFHIDFPNDDELVQIAEKRFGKLSQFLNEFMNIAIDHFKKIREMDLKKIPATAEFLAWLNIIEHLLDSPKIDMQNLTKKQAQKIALSYTVLIKSREDLKRVQKALDEYTIKD